MTDDIPKITLRLCYRFQCLQCGRQNHVGGETNEGDRLYCAWCAAPYDATFVWDSPTLVPN